MPSNAVSLGALVAALVAGWFLFLRNKGDSTAPAPLPTNGSAAKPPANGVVDTGRDFVASLKLSVSRSLLSHVPDGGSRRGRTRWSRVAELVGPCRVE